MTGTAYRCESCGEFLDDKEVSDGSHDRIVYDENGPSHLELCGPVHVVCQEDA